MTWVAAGLGGASLLTGLFGAKKQGDANAAARSAATVPFGSTSAVGPNGMFANAGDNGFSFGLGDLTPAFAGAGGLSNMGFMGAQDALQRGVPQDVMNAAGAFRNFDPNLGPLQGFAGGAGMLGGAALGQAFSGNNTGTYTNQALAALRAQAAPQNAQSMRDFTQGLYSTGRGAVTGAPGAEDTAGGGALAAAFARGLGQSDLDLQTKAQQYGINGATSDSNLMTAAFGRFGNMADLGSSLNNQMFTRGYGIAQNNYNTSKDMAMLPPQIAAAFANLGTVGTNNAVNYGNFGINFGQAGLQNQIARSNAARGSATNLANLATNTSASPVLDAFRDFGVGAAGPDWMKGAIDGFKRIGNGNSNPMISPTTNYGASAAGMNAVYSGMMVDQP
jgi:hypothetical protein